MPWQGWEPPALVFCEEQLNGWIRTPANTWSSFAFCIVGIIILIRELKRPDHDQFLMGYGPMAIALGLLSAFYHASLTRIGEIGDLSSMFLISVWLVTTNMERMGWLTLMQGRFWFWVIQIISTGLLFFVKHLGAPLFFVQCMTALVLEFKLIATGRGAPTYRYLIAGATCWIAAQTIWALDLSRVVCRPENHWVQGHAIWHVLMAGLTWFVYLHYDLIRNRLNKTVG